MAGDDRFADAYGTETAVLIIVQIGSADPAGGHAQQHLARPERRHLLSLDPQVACSV
ncbi:hypothetical protein D3C72_2357190 [compost metagenome]